MLEKPKIYRIWGYEIKMFRKKEYEMPKPEPKESLMPTTPKLNLKPEPRRIEKESESDVTNEDIILNITLLSRKLFDLETALKRKTLVTDLKTENEIRNEADLTKISLDYYKELAISRGYKEEDIEAMVIHISNSYEFILVK